MKRSNVLILSMLILTLAIAVRAADIRKNGQTSNVVRFYLTKDGNNGSLSGNGLTGVGTATSGLIISTIADTEASATIYTAAGGSVETIATLGTYAAPSSGKVRLKEVDSTNMPGFYEFQIADARFAVSNAKHLVVSVIGVSSLSESRYEIELVSFDPFDSVRMGQSALANASAGAAGGLVIGAEAGSLDINANGTLLFAGHTLVHNPATVTNVLQLNGGTPTLFGGGAGTLMTTAYALNDLNFTTTAFDTVHTFGNATTTFGVGTVTIANGLSAASLLVNGNATFSGISTSAIFLGTTTFGAILLNNPSTISLSTANVGSVLNSTGALGSVTLNSTQGTLNIATLTVANAGIGTTAAAAGAAWVNGTLSTLTTYTGNTPQTGDSFGRIGATGSGLTSLAPSATALSTVQWTNQRAGNLDNLDALLSSRSTYDGSDTSGVVTLLTRIPSALTITGGKVDVNDKTGFSLSVTPPTAAQIRTEMEGAGTKLTLVKTATDALGTAMVLDGSVYKFTPNALEDAPGGGGGALSSDQNAALMGIWKKEGKPNP